MIRERPFTWQITSEELASDRGRLMLLCFRNNGIRVGERTRCGRWCCGLLSVIRECLHRYLVNEHSKEIDETSSWLNDYESSQENLCNDLEHTVEHLVTYTLIHQHEQCFYKEELHVGMVTPIHEENWSKGELDGLHKKFRQRGEVVLLWPHQHRYHRKR